MTQMKRVYINVTKYANKNALTLEQAHKEIQPFLFALGYNWECKAHHNKVVLTYAEHLELHMEKDWTITQCPSEAFAEADYDYEWGLERKVSLSYTYCPVNHEPEYVEFNGKQYDKAKLEQALKLIEGDELNDKLERNYE